MMMAPAGVKVHLALGVTDMRKGMDGLAMVVQAPSDADLSCSRIRPRSQRDVVSKGCSAVLRTLFSPRPGAAAA